MRNHTSKFWELVTTDGTQLDTFTRLQFKAAMGAAADHRARGTACDVRKIVEGR